MPASLPASEVDFPEAQERIPRTASAWFKFTGMSAAATLILTAAFSIHPTTPVRAGAEVQTSPNAQAPHPANPSTFAPEIRWKLKTQQDRMVSLANQLTRRGEPTGDLEDQLLSLEIGVKSAAADFENAKLTREVAEIAVVEYEEGIFLQDKQTLEGERVLAESDVGRKEDRFALAKHLLAENKPPSKSTPAETAQESRLVDMVEREEIDLRRAELALANVKSKLKFLEKHTKPKRVKELRSQVEKARADELAERAEWELKQSRAKRLQTAISARRLPAAERRARDAEDRQTRASLGRAISIAEQLQTKLEELTRNAKPDDPAQGEIRDLSNKFQVLVDQAEADRSAAEFDALKARIHSAAN